MTIIENNALLLIKMISKDLPEERYDKFKFFKYILSLSGFYIIYVTSNIANAIEKNLNTPAGIIVVNQNTFVKNEIETIRKIHENNPGFKNNCCNIG